MRYCTNNAVTEYHINNTCETHRIITNLSSEDCCLH